MNRVMVILLLGFLGTVYSIANDNEILSVSLEIKKPLKSSPYGEWRLSKIDPASMNDVFKGKIEKQNNDRAAPFIIEGGVEIFDKDMYEDVYLITGVNELDWVPKKGTIADEMWYVSPETKALIQESDFFRNYHRQDDRQEFDWNMAMADYLNSTITPVPPFLITINNNSNKQIKITAFYTKTVFTTGGEASPGAAYISPESKINLLTLHWNRSNKLILEEPLVILSKSKKTLPISSTVEKGAQGDGPGRLTYALFVEYMILGEKKTQLLTLISQSEDYGFFTMGR